MNSSKFQFMSPGCETADTCRGELLIFSKYLEILKWDNLSQLCPEWQLSDFSVKTRLRDLPPLSVDVRVVVELVDHGGPLRHLGLVRHPAAGEDGRVVTEMKMSNPSLWLRVWLGGPAEHDILEGLPVLDTHEGVEEGVEGAGEVVQDPWHVTSVNIIVWSQELMG